MSDLQLFDALPPHIEAALRDSIEEFGVLVPVFVTQDGEVLDGHHRSRIARDLGVQFETTVVEVEDEEHALRIAHTLNSDRRQLSTGDRLAAAARLRERGHSYRAIGEALGVDDRTVRRDVEKATEAGAAVQPERVVGIDGKSRPATKPPTVKTTERRSESTTVERTPELPPLDLSTLPGEDDRAYVRAFVTALSGWHRPMRFDAERLAVLVDQQVAEQVAISAASVAEFAEQFRKARSGLRVVEGGRR